MRNIAIVFEVVGDKCGTSVERVHKLHECSGVGWGWLHVQHPETSEAMSLPRHHWDRCGPLSPACERFFVMEACFYECEPAAGLFRRYPTSDFTAHDREGHIESRRLPGHSSN